jgi:ActR/RegA family two-component response regulator
MGLPETGATELLVADLSDLQMPKHTPAFLVIDDDPVQQMTIARVGSKAGYAVTTASTLEEAAREIKGQHFDCITLDLLLGGENGMVMLGEIAKYNPGTMVIVISGASPAVREATLQIATDLHLDSAELPKPVNFAALRLLLADRKAARPS